MDYKRFLEGLKEFNTSELVTIQLIRKLHNCSLVSDPSANLVSGRVANNQPLVKILCYCLMPNHFHLLLKQITDNGIQEFVKKVCGGYTSYFNIKNERQGHLFQGPFKAVLVDKESQFLHLSRYIHLNALDLFQPEWREGKITDWEGAKNFLEQYPWSSYPVFVGKQTSDFCRPELLSEIFKTPKDYESHLKDWVERDYAYVQELALE